jgi:hypothetical protein
VELEATVRARMFPLTWVVVHPFGERSPLRGKASRHDEIVTGARFTLAFEINSEGDMVLQVDQVGSHARVDVSS